MPFIQFQHRRDTAANWNLANPILAPGEMGLESDTTLFKLGNGTTAWSGLAYGGLKGATGPTGTSGVVGATGPTGPSVVGATGPTGTAGSSVINYYVETYAGNGAIGAHDAANGLGARIESPYGICIDLSNNLYVSDGTNLIRKISVLSGVTSLAGNGSTGWVDGIGTSASFFQPSGLSFNSLNSTISIADTGNNAIRTLTLSNANVSTFFGLGPTGAGFVDGPLSIAKLSGPVGCAWDADNIRLWISDRGNNQLRYTYQGSLASFFSQTGTTQSVSVKKTAGRAWYLSSNRHIIGDLYMTTNVFGGDGIPGYADGIGTAARFNTPTGIAMDKNGIYLYVADSGNHKIRRINTITREVTTIAGSTQGFADGVGTAAMFNKPWNLVVDSEDNIFVTDRDNNRIRRISQF
jgi:hypothetical protein